MIFSSVSLGFVKVFKVMVRPLVLEYKEGLHSLCGELGHSLGSSSYSQTVSLATINSTKCMSFSVFGLVFAYLP